MSKRYGRNQKRKARERIAELEAALLETARVMAFQRNRADKLEQRAVEWARRIRRVCGEDHPFNERVRQVAMRRLPSNRERFQLMPPLRLDDVLREIASSATESAATYIDCAVHELDYRQRPPEGVAGAMIELVGPDGSSVLAVDRRFLLEALDDPEFERWTAKRLVEHMKGERVAMRKPRAA